jgi:hypothetical protein
MRAEPFAEDAVGRRAACARCGDDLVEQSDCRLDPGRGGHKVFLPGTGRGTMRSMVVGHPAGS